MAERTTRLAALIIHPITTTAYARFGGVWQTREVATAIALAAGAKMKGMKSLHYLTVQDVLWINLQVTGKVETYRYADLEEATYYQYAYGESTSLAPQAARFLGGFVAKAPLANANEATAFLSTLAFLEINGMDLSLSDADAPAWFARAAASKSGTPTAIQEVASEGHSHHAGVPDMKATVRDLLKRYPNTVSGLTPALLG